MIDDKEPYNRIGRILVKLLPQNWEKVDFRMEVQGERVSWSAKFSLIEKESGARKEDLLHLDLELLNALEELRNTTIFPKISCNLIFYSNKTYIVKSDRNMVPVGCPDISEVEHAIQKLKTIDIKSIDIDVLKKHLGTIIPGYVLNSPIIPKDTIIYRGVKWEDKPKNIEDLSYPPKKYIKNYHRAGRPGKTLFYGTFDREAIFYELGLVPGDRVAISHWKTTAPIVVNNVGYHDDVFGMLNSKRDCPTWGKGTEFETLEKTTSFIKKFFASEFAIIVLSGNEHLYKLSIAIAELHFSNELFGGLLYPSIAMRANADNLALKPELVDKYLQIQKVEHIRIDEENNQGFKVTILDFALTFDAENRIQWKGQHPL